jgi:hypothetical protein
VNNLKVPPYYTTKTFEDPVAIRMFVEAFRRSPETARALPCTNTFVLLATTFLGLEQGDGGVLGVVPGAGVKVPLQVFY